MSQIGTMITGMEHTFSKSQKTPLKLPYFSRKRVGWVMFE